MNLVVNSLQNYVPSRFVYAHGIPFSNGLEVKLLEAVEEVAETVAHFCMRHQDLIQFLVTDSFSQALTVPCQLRR